MPAGRRAGVEVWLGPAALVPARVDGLAVVEVVGSGGRGAGLPGGIRRDGLDVTVFELNIQLAEEAQFAAVEVGHAVPGEAPAVPAVAQGHSDHRGRLHQRRDVVAAEAEPPLVRAPARAQHVLTHGNPVDQGLVNAVGRGPQRGLGDCAVPLRQPELLAQERGAVEVFVGGDHGCLPGCRWHVVVFRSV
jgi:hypothetical protein